MLRVQVSPAVLNWALERSGRLPGELATKLPGIQRWQTGAVQPTLRQLEALAKATFTPLGYLFLSEPPVERLPIPYYRTLRDNQPHRPSANLLSAVQAMQRRQAWMREYLVDEGLEPLEFVASAGRDTGPRSVASEMRRTLGLPVGWAAKQPTWGDALRSLRAAAEGSGILVAASGIVGSNTHRKLDPQEFRGFVLVDNYAPLIFINSADFRAAQMFTLAHELAHVWYGSSAAFDLRELRPSSDATEQACNRAAAEFLVPEMELRPEWLAVKRESNNDRIQRTARHFKVSVLVAARRALDLRLISLDAFLEFYRGYLAQQRGKPVSEGGDFYATAGSRIGQRFASTIWQAVKEGKLLYQEAYDLTDLHGETFERFFSQHL